MPIEDEIRSYSAEIETLRRQVGVARLAAYVQTGESGTPEPLFVADFDTARLKGYSDRFFEMMFGLQRIFARPVEVLEQEIFEREVKPGTVAPVSLDVLHATA